MIIKCRLCGKEFKHATGSRSQEGVGRQGMKMNTYIEVYYIDDEGVESCYGMKISAEVKQGLTALEIAKMLLPDGIECQNAKFITEEEYKQDYGDEDD